LAAKKTYQLHSTKNPLRFQVDDWLLAWTCLPQFQQTPQIDMDKKTSCLLRQLTSAQKSEHLNEVMDAFAFLSQATIHLCPTTG